MSTNTIESDLFIVKIGDPFELVPINKIPGYSNLMIVKISECYKLSDRFVPDEFKGELIQRRGENETKKDFKAKTKEKLLDLIKRHIQKKVLFL